jgi:aspartate-semialdehyde dehydrogenase
MKDDAVIILDPVNLDVIKDALAKGGRRLDRRQLHRQPDADGARRLFKAGLVEWMTSMTYQAAPAPVRRTCANCSSQMGETHAW